MSPLPSSQKKISASSLATALGPLLYRKHQVLSPAGGRLSLKDILENDPEAYYEKHELLEPLKVMHRSLIHTNDNFIANGRLLDVIRQINCFGLGMVQLDIRQESTRHADALDAVTQYLGLGSYKCVPCRWLLGSVVCTPEFRPREIVPTQPPGEHRLLSVGASTFAETGKGPHAFVMTRSEWDEQKRQDFLIGELSSKRPLLPPGLQTAPEVTDVINTFRTLSNLPPDSLAAYVISMAHTASDVLAVVLLQVPPLPGAARATHDRLSKSGSLV